MAKIEVKLKDPTKIAWDQETGFTITGSDPVTVEESRFIHAKIAEGVLVKSDYSEPIKPGKRKRDGIYNGEA